MGENLANSPPLELLLEEGEILQFTPHHPSTEDTNKRILYWGPPKCGNVIFFFFSLDVLGRVHSMLKNLSNARVSFVVFG